MIQMEIVEYSNYRIACELIRPIYPVDLIIGAQQRELRPFWDSFVSAVLVISHNLCCLRSVRRNDERLQ